MTNIKAFSYPKVANSVESSVLGETNVWNQGSSKLSVVGRGGYQLKLCPATHISVATVYMRNILKYFDNILTGTHLKATVLLVLKGLKNVLLNSE